MKDCKVEGKASWALGAQISCTEFNGQGTCIQDPATSDVSLPTGRINFNEGTPTNTLCYVAVPKDQYTLCFKESSCVSLSGSVTYDDGYWPGGPNGTENGSRPDGSSKPFDILSGSSWWVWLIIAIVVLIFGLPLINIILTMFSSLSMTTKSLNTLSKFKYKSKRQ